MHAYVCVPRVTPVVPVTVPNVGAARLGEQGLAAKAKEIQINTTTILVTHPNPNIPHPLADAPVHVGAALLHVPAVVHVVIAVPLRV